MRSTFVIAIPILISAAYSQTPTAKLTFEVASVKLGAPMGSREDRQVTKIDAAHVEITGSSLMALVMRAYRVKYDQVVRPDWLASSRFDVVAKLPEGSSVDDVPEMLQALLMERFRLVVHREDREFPGYGLVIGKRGQHLMRKSPDYDPSKTQLRPTTIEAYLDILRSQFLDGPVIDMTGLKGEYMIDHPAVFRELMAAQQASMSHSGTETIDMSGAMAAVDQLGLKLEPRKVPINMLVIDHVEKTPAGN